MSQTCTSIVSVCTPRKDYWHTLDVYTSMPEKKRKANSILQFCRTLHVHVSDLLIPYIKNLSFATLAKFSIVVYIALFVWFLNLCLLIQGNEEHAYLLATSVCSTTKLLAKYIHSTKLTTFWKTSFTEF